MTADELTRLLEPEIERLGYELADLEVRLGGRGGAAGSAGSVGIGFNGGVSTSGDNAPALMATSTGGGGGSAGGGAMSSSHGISRGPSMQGR